MVLLLLPMLRLLLLLLVPTALITVLDLLEMFEDTGSPRAR